MRGLTGFISAEDMEQLKGVPLIPGQHPARRWEYMMAMRAAVAAALTIHTNVATWPFALDVGGVALDVGGAGSMLSNQLRRIGWNCRVVDPKVNYPLHDYREPAVALVTCVSVIEHVPDLEEFIHDLARVTALEGVLFLTSDVWDQPETEPDRAHWHWMRKRIFTPKTWMHLATRFTEDYGFVPVGEQDWRWHGYEIEPGWGYGFGAMTLRKVGA